MTNKSQWTPADCQIKFILDSIHEAVVAVNEQGIINVFNTAAQQILNIPSKEIVGHFASEVIPSSRLHLVLQSGVPELNQQQKIGSMRILTSRLPLRNQDNQVVGVVAVFHDITEMKHLTEEITDITEMKLLLESIIDATQDVISVTDQEGRIILVNPAYTKLIGLSREEVLGKTATIDIRKGESMHIHVMKTLEPVRYVPLQAGPQRKEIIVSAAPIIVSGQLRGSVAVAHDISELRKLTEELGRMKSLVRQIQSHYTFDDIVCKSSVMLKTVDRARRAAGTPVTVLLNGESGTGKELFAHAIHHASQHKNTPFIRVNCAAIPEALLESELFGYEEGAFTGARKGGKKGLFEEANGGTIFLDEIGEIPLASQAKLLRVLQEKEVLRVGSVRPIPVCIRIIAATNRNLAAIVQNGTFREDLYYRINVFPITIPPLRNRIEELPELSCFLLKKLNEEYGRNVQALSSDSLAILSDYHWPGNVRELENVLAGGMINMLFNETVMSAKDLPKLGSKAQSPVSSTVSQTSAVVPPILGPTLEETERRIIIAALTANQGNRAATAKNLGISIRNLYYKLSKFHISEAENTFH
jgi:PAS domain S-box-containing protein